MRYLIRERPNTRSTQTQIGPTFFASFVLKGSVITSAYKSICYSVNSEPNPNHISAVRIQLVAFSLILLCSLAITQNGAKVSRTRSFVHSQHGDNQHSRVSVKRTSTIRVNVSKAHPIQRRKDDFDHGARFHPSRRVPSPARNLPAHLQQEATLSPPRCTVQALRLSGPPH